MRFACPSEHRSRCQPTCHASRASFGSPPTWGTARLKLRRTWSSPGPRRLAPRRRLRTSLHRLAAVNHHRGSGDEGSRIRTQPQDGRGDLLRLAGPAYWLGRSRARELPLLPLRGAPAEAIHHWRVDDAGAHDIDADVLRGVVEGRRLRQADHTVFLRDVRRLILEALDPGARGRVHDCDAPLLE